MDPMMHTSGGGCLRYCWLNCSSMRVAWAGPQVGPWLLQMISFYLLMGERSTPLRWWSVHIRCGCPVFSVVSIFLMPAVRQSFVSPQRNDRSVAIARPLLLGGRQHHRSSAAPDAQSLQDPAKDPRLKMSGRRQVRTWDLPVQKRSRYHYSTPHSPNKHLH